MHQVDNRVLKTNFLDNESKESDAARVQKWSIALRPSLFAHLVEREDEFCIYHSLRIITRYFPKYILPWLSKVDHCSINEVLPKVPLFHRDEFLSCVDKLCDDALLIPVDYNEKDYIKQVKKKVFAREEGRIRVMVIHLTGHCNLACKYCFVDGGKVPGFDHIKMNSETARLAIDHFAKALSSVPPSNDREVAQAPAVVFYGGEPLLNEKVFGETLEYIQKLKENGTLPSDFNKVLITNGTRITSELASIIAKHQVSVSISIDGPKYIHDSNRINHGGQGSFEQVMVGYRNLRNAGIRPSIACVVAPEGVAHIEEIIRFFVEELGVKAVGMNHVSILPENGYHYNEQYEVDFAKAVIAGQELILQYNDVYERRMSQKLNSFLDQKVVKADCTGCGEQVAVSATGQINVCQGYVGSPNKHDVGHVQDPNLDLNQSRAVREWTGRSPLTMNSCHGCISLATCGGGCPRNAESLHGSIWSVDTAFCHFSRMATKWMIWKKRDAMLSEKTLAVAKK